MGCVDKDLFCSKLTVILIGIGSAGLVVSIYHWITVVYCSRTRQDVVTRGDLMAENVSIENSTIQLIPAHSYKKGKNTAAAEEEEDRTCSICLCEFEEGEQVRSLPECSHYFHVPCIDMWLYAHSSCPMCRADATPPPSIFPGLVLQDDEDRRSRQETADLEHVLQVL